MCQACLKAAAVAVSRLTVLKAVGPPELRETVRIEVALGEALWKVHSAARVPAIARASAALARGGGTPSEAALEASGAYHEAFDKRALSLLPPATRRVYELGKQAMANRITGKRRERLDVAPRPVAKAGPQITVGFTQVDEDALTALGRAQTLWIGEVSDTVVSNRVRAAAEEMVRQGASAAEAARRLPGMLSDAGLKDLKIPTGWSGSEREYFRGLASHAATVSRVQGSIGAMTEAGVDVYTIVNPQDERTCPTCAMLDGKVVKVDTARDQMAREAAADTPDKLREAHPFLRDSWVAAAREGGARPGQQWSSAVRGDVGEDVGLPPFHYLCRCSIDVSSEFIPIEVPVAPPVSIAPMVPTPKPTPKPTPSRPAVPKPATPKPAKAPKPVESKPVAPGDEAPKLGLPERTWEPATGPSTDHVREAISAMQVELDAAMVRASANAARTGVSVESAFEKEYRALIGKSGGFDASISVSETATKNPGLYGDLPSSRTRTIRKLGVEPDSESMRKYKEVMGDFSRKYVSTAYTGEGSRAPCVWRTDKGRGWHMQMGHTRVKKPGVRSAMRLPGASREFTAHNAQTVVHEHGHYMETFGWNGKAAAKYRDIRAGGEKPVPLLQFGRGYKPDELTNRDKWLDPYTGKVCGSEASEITSMGVGRLYSNGPATFYREDKEHLSFLTLTLRGHWLLRKW